MRMTPRPLVSVLSLALLVAAVGCASTSSSAPPAVGATTHAIATEERGPLRAVGQAFAEVPLTPEQRTRIEALFRATEARHGQAWKESSSARKDLLLALADQVQAGAIDKAALAPKLEAATLPWRKAREADRAALIDLHAALTPDQRKAFVEAFHPEKMHHGKKHGDAKHDDAKHAETNEGRAFGRGHVWKELDLSSDQKEKLKQTMRAEMGAKREAFAQHREQGKKALESFASNALPNETAEGLLRGNARGAEGRLEHMLHFVEVAMPVLTPEQRTKAATMLRERAAANAAEHPDTHG